MISKLGRLFALCFLLVAPTTALPQIASQLYGMEGWTIAETTKVDGEFEGCDFDKVIHFFSGIALVCSTFHYTYAYMPDAVIFVRALNHKGNEYFQMKALIGDHVYDMLPILKK